MKADKSARHRSIDKILEEASKIAATEFKHAETIQSKAGYVFKRFDDELENIKQKIVKLNCAPELKDEISRVAVDRRREPVASDVLARGGGGRYARARLRDGRGLL